MSVMRIRCGRCAVICCITAYRSRLSWRRSTATPVLEAATINPGNVGDGRVSTWEAAPKSAARKIEIVVAPSTEIVVTLDTDLVTRTVENIFDNALRYTPSGGTIEVELRETGSDVEIRIGNSGRAIPIGERGAIFEKHRQEGSEVGHMNLGLGLYFCRLAIGAHGGRIWIEETDRLPTVFGIRLPRRLANTATHAIAEPLGAAS